MLLTTNMGPLRWTLRHWREHRSRAGGPCGLQHEKRRKSECVLRRAHVSSDRCNIVRSHRPFLSCDGRGPSNVSVFESRQDKITVTSSRLDSDTLCARCKIQASQPRHRATSSHPLATVCTSVKSKGDEKNQSFVPPHGTSRHAPQPAPRLSRPALMARCSSHPFSRASRTTHPMHRTASRHLCIVQGST